MNFFTKKEDDFSKIKKEFNETQIAKTVLSIRKNVGLLIIVSFIVEMVIEIDSVKNVIGDNFASYSDILLLFWITWWIIITIAYYYFLKEFTKE